MERRGPVFRCRGFLISGLLFGEYSKTGGIRFRRFAIPRAIKIYRDSSHWFW
jgi:hypothetical protein